MYLTSWPRSLRGLLIFIDEAEAFLCSRSNQSNAYVQAALSGAKSYLGTVAALKVFFAHLTTLFGSPCSQLLDLSWLGFQSALVKTLLHNCQKLRSFFLAQTGSSSSRLQLILATNRVQERRDSLFSKQHLSCTRIG